MLPFFRNDCHHVILFGRSFLILFKIRNTEKISILGEHYGTIITCVRDIRNNYGSHQRTGQMIYEKICNLIDAGNTVSLDFSDVESILSPFLNVAVGKLYNKYSSDTLNQKLNITGISDEQYNIFEIVISNAKSYYKDSQSFDQAVMNGCD